MTINPINLHLPLITQSKTQHLNMLLPKRLISAPLGSPISRLLSTLLRATKIRTRNPLICIRRLLNLNLLLIPLSAAAAHGNQPEEARGDGEGDAEPDDAEHVFAEEGLDVVGFEDGAEGAGEGGVDGGRGYGGAEDEDGGGLGTNISFCCGGGWRDEGNLQ